MSRRKKTSPGPPTIRASVDPGRGIQLLNRQIESGRRLLSVTLTCDEYRAWKTVTNDFLIKVFGSESPNVSRVINVGTLSVSWGSRSEAEWERKRKENLTTQIRVLESLVELLQTEIEICGGHPPIDATEDSVPNGHAVFLVHGHDEAALHATARFLEHLEVDVIVLREQPNQGRTIIEKFIDHSAVGFAVVLLTADDKGASASVPGDHLRPRARQNVILELGFFLGKLGRECVCALYHEGVEIPSDYAGVLFVALDDSGAWKLTLARELKAAGLPIDMNRAV